VSAIATVAVGGITGGNDEEGTEQLRARYLLRLREPPEGGADQDYEEWALEVPGVTRAWVYPHENGLGTVVVRFVRDLDAGSIFPDVGEVAAVQAKLDAERPVTDEPTAVAPTNLASLHGAAGPEHADTQAAVTAELADLFKRRPAGRRRRRGHDLPLADPHGDRRRRGRQRTTRSRRRRLTSSRRSAAPDARRHHVGVVADGYQRMMLKLLPPGRLWRFFNSLFSDLFQGCADELERLDARAGDLLRESVPSKAVEMLPEYEDELDIVAAARPPNDRRASSLVWSRGSGSAQSTFRTRSRLCSASRRRTS
jgi:hypothetical protein